MKPTGQFAGEQLPGGREFTFILRCNGGGDPLGFGEIEPAIEIRPGGELPRLRLARAAGDQGIEKHSCQ